MIIPMEMSIKTKILERLSFEIKQKREEKGWSRSKLVEKLQLNGVDIQAETLKSYENKKRDMKSSTVFVLAYVLGLDLNNIAKEVPNFLDELYK